MAATLQSMPHTFENNGRDGHFVQPSPPSLRFSSHSNVQSFGSAVPPQVAAQFISRNNMYSNQVGYTQSSDSQPLTLNVPYASLPTSNWAYAQPEQIHQDGEQYVMANDAKLNAHYTYQQAEMRKIPGIEEPSAHQQWQWVELMESIRRQTEYYFCADNLANDIFLRLQMDSEGWVSIPLLASFHRMKRLTQNVMVIEQAIVASPDLEINNHMVRKKNDWERWLLPPQGPVSTQPRQTTPPSQTVEEIKKKAQEPDTSKKDTSTTHTEEKPKRAVSPPETTHSKKKTKNREKDRIALVDATVAEFVLPDDTSSTCNSNESMSLSPSEADSAAATEDQMLPEQLEWKTVQSHMYHELNGDRLESQSLVKLTCSSTSKRVAMPCPVVRSPPAVASPMCSDSSIRKRRSTCNKQRASIVSSGLAAPQPSCAQATPRKLNKLKVKDLGSKDAKEDSTSLLCEGTSKAQAASKASRKRRNDQEQARPNLKYHRLVRHLLVAAVIIGVFLHVGMSYFWGEESASLLSAESPDVTTATQVKQEMRSMLNQS